MLLRPATPFRSVPAPRPDQSEQGSDADPQLVIEQELAHALLTHDTALIFEHNLDAKNQRVDVVAACLNVAGVPADGFVHNGDVSG
jgi:hypothetical protein